MNLPKDIKSLGFTLVELMVVISIIGILSATGAVIYSSVNVNNRDATRKRDLNSIKQALELYFQTNSSYPGNTGISSTLTFDQSNNRVTGLWIPLLIPTYFDTIPVDPINSGNYVYTYISSQTPIISTAYQSYQPLMPSTPTSCPAFSVLPQYYILTAALEGLSNTSGSNSSLYGCSEGGAATIPITPQTYYLLSQ